MPFLSGSVSLQRLAVPGASPAVDDDLLDKLREHAFGNVGGSEPILAERGWAAGKHILDRDFSLEKNCFASHLAWDYRVRTNKLPADRLKAYYETDLAALAKGNPSGIASIRQRKEARESARERLEEEAKDGRYTRDKVTPCLWDVNRSEVYLGATSTAAVSSFSALFQQTFGVDPQYVSAGRIAVMSHEVSDLTPARFVPGGNDDVAWIADGSTPDWLGNEFLLWLWFYTDAESDTIRHGDGDITVMMARSLTLECPRGQTGRESISHEGPTRLPEARRAIQSGKLPRKAGLTLVRHGEMFEFQLAAESLAISGAKLPKPEGESPRGRIEERLGMIRNLIDAVDDLYATFLEIRTASTWMDTLAAMQKWLGREGRRAA